MFGTCFTYAVPTCEKPFIATVDPQHHCFAKAKDSARRWFGSYGVAATALSIQ